MKRTITTTAVAILTACATVPDKEAHLPAQGGACIEQRPTIDGKSSAIRWCIASQMFQPRNYNVTIDGKSVFSGTDYKRIQFTSESESGPIQGKCEEYVTLIDNNINAPVAIALIPQTTIEACKIAATSDGKSTQFIKSEQCDKSFYKDIGPLIGPIVPVENMRKCTLVLKNKVIFDGIFTTARRF